MALTAKLLDRLVPLLKEGDGVLALGYPDIICDVSQWTDKPVATREDSEKICKRHGIAQNKISDAESFFEALGCTLDVFDVVQERGTEILVDLNFPLPANACEQFEFALDVGTLEHCFNLPQALINVACSVKVGGYTFHENPFNWGNHGFYNLNPTLFCDFYTDNGFEIVEQILVTKDGSQVWNAPATKRFVFNGPEVNIFTIARRVEVKDMAFPTQTKYRGH